MKLHELRAPQGASRKAKRKGRGQATGLGTTAGRGMNGQNSRSGGGVKLGFEGGQMPLYRRLPKRGFTNRFAKKYNVINVSDLERFDNGTEVSLEELCNAGIIKQPEARLKVLGDGELSKKLTVKAAKFSKMAAEKIEGAGGKAEVI